MRLINRLTWFTEPCIVEASGQMAMEKHEIRLIRKGSVMRASFLTDERKWLFRNKGWMSVFLTASFEIQSIRERHLTFHVQYS